MNDLLLSAKDITKVYHQGDSYLEILKGVSLDIKRGESISVMGRSGAGKSTLLHILGSLDLPSSGAIFWSGQNLLEKSDEEISYFRNKMMGFVFQSHHLLPEFNALENVMLPSLIGGLSRSLAKKAALELLKEVGMEHRLSHYPSELSGGERQRISIARALVRKPSIVFADEPTGNLDSENALKIQALLFHLQEKYNMALLVVTHEQAFAAKFPKQLQMKDGLWA